MSDFRPMPLPLIQGDLWTVARRLAEWADRVGLPHLGESDVELVLPVPKPRPEWTRQYIDPECLP